MSPFIKDEDKDAYCESVEVALVRLLMAISPGILFIPESAVGHVDAAIARCGWLNGVARTAAMEKKA